MEEPMKALRRKTRGRGDAGTGRIMNPLRVSVSPCLRVALSISLALAALILNFPSSAQRRARSGAHSSVARDTFTAADRTTVERAIGTTCAERIRDPLGSTPIDEMQARPSLSTNHPDAVAGARRAERLLPATRKLVSAAITQLAKDYGFYDNAAARARINAATARVQEFGTIFLAGLRSDEAMISVLAHELTHVAGGQSDVLRPLYRAIARRAATRTELRIQGQRAEELACDLIGLIAAREFIKQTPSWEPQPRRLARAVEHNCVDDDSSDEDHLSPRNTIRALFALDVIFARELVSQSTDTSGPQINSLTVRAPAF